MNVQYFFNPYPVPFIPNVVKGVVSALALGVAVSIALFLYTKGARLDPPKKRIVKRLFHWCVAVVGVTLALFFFRQQRVYILAMPAVAVVVYLGLTAWLVRLIVLIMKRFPHEARLWREEETRRKYLSSSR